MLVWPIGTLTIRSVRLNASATWKVCVDELRKIEPVLRVPLMLSLIVAAGELIENVPALSVLLMLLLFAVPVRLSVPPPSATIALLAMPSSSVKVNVESDEATLPNDWLKPLSSCGVDSRSHQR